MYIMRHIFKNKRRYLAVIVFIISIALLIITIPNIQNKKTELSIYDKADQMIIIGIKGSEISEKQDKNNSDIVQILNNMNVGGIILFDYDTGTKTFNRNIKSTNQLDTFIEEIKQLAKTPLFIALDEEGGQVSRLKKLEDYNKTASEKNISKLNPQKIEEIFKWRAEQISAYGFNMNFAPTVDLCYQDSVIDKQERCFSNNPTNVSALALSFSKYMKLKNVAPVFKHYPGLGTGKFDTHTGAVDITTSHTDADYQPYRDICDHEQYPIIMVSHSIMKTIDKLPASLSKKHIEKLKSLGCKNALIISDDMDMKSITNTFKLKDVLEKSINAGDDLLIFSNNMGKYDKEKYIKIQTTLHELIDSGSIPTERINEVYEKIMNYKKQYSVVK